MVGHVSNGSGGEETPLRIANVPVALIIRAYVTVLVPEHISEEDKEKYAKQAGSEIITANIREIAQKPEDFSIDGAAYLITTFTKLHHDFPIMVAPCLGDIEWPGEA